MEKSADKQIIISIGDPIIDILAELDENCISKYNLEVGRSTMKTVQNEGMFDFMESQPDLRYLPGGSVTNSMRIANWLFKKDPNFGCAVLGCIGNDNFGKTLENELKKAGILPLLEITEKYQTSRCAVGIYKKERCLLTDIQASNKLSLEYVMKKLDIISQANLLLIEGYFVIYKHDIVKLLASHFASKKKKIAFTLSAPFMVEKFYDKMLEISNMSNLLFCNEDEAFEFAKINSNNYEEISLKIHYMLTPFDRLLIITCGSKPTVISKYDYVQNKLDFIIMSSVYKIENHELVDTNGCGDSFVGGFLSQYIKSASIEKCAKAGNWAASVVIRNIGCSFPQEMNIKEF